MNVLTKPRVFALVGDIITVMEDVVDHLLCEIDVTAYPYYCGNHEVYLYDGREIEHDEN